MRENQRPPPGSSGGGLQNNERLGRLLGGDFSEDDDAPQSQSAPPSAVDAVDLARFDYLAEVLDYADSYAVSAREAARRGNHQLVKLHTSQAKTAVDAALEVASEFGTLDTAPA